MRSALLLLVLGASTAHAQAQLAPPPLKAQTYRAPTNVLAPSSSTAMAMPPPTAEQRIARLEAQLAETRAQLAELKQRYETHVHPLTLGATSTGSFMMRPGTDLRATVVISNSDDAHRYTRGPVATPGR